MKHLSLLIVCLLVAGCSSSGDATTTTVAPTTTALGVTTTTNAAATTTTNADTTTTTAPPETTTTSATADGFHPDLPVTLGPPDPLPGSDGAAGSGCAPGSDALPDGVWFVFMPEAPTDVISADLACFWFGERAEEIGEETGQEVPSGFLITNDSEALRSVPVGPDVVVWTIAGDPTEGHTEMTIGEWPSETPTYTWCPGEYCTIWLYVNDGVVTDIVEQYLP